MNFISSSQVAQEFDHIYQKAIKQPLDKQKGLRLATLFYEPSTRTRLSFEAAALKVGMDVISTENMSNSSMSKGETIRDMLATVSMFADFVVVRHPQNIFLDQDLFKNCNKFCSFINAGCGSDEHPTQALIDMFTIRKELGEDNIYRKKILVVGDLKYGRAAKSFIRAATDMNEEIYCYSPSALQLPLEMAKSVKDILPQELDILLPEIDVLYMTRMQKERWTTGIHVDSEWSKYSISQGWLDKMKKDSIILHPMPRGREIPDFVDSDPRAKYFRQIQYGVNVRAALLTCFS